MVIKTELCAFSEYRIYPGNGQLFIRRDGRPVTLGSSKAKSLLAQRKKPAKLVWTQRWRIQNKKGLSETTSKKRARKVVKIQRAVVGASMEEIKKVMMCLVRVGCRGFACIVQFWNCRG